MVGIDLIEVERIKQSLNKTGFIEKILLPGEIEYVNQFKVNMEAHVAGFFCAKEAVMKALQDCKKISFLEIEVKHQTNGAPYIVLTGEAKRVFEKQKLTSLEISISQTDNYATAICLIKA